MLETCPVTRNETTSYFQKYFKASKVVSYLSKLYHEDLNTKGLGVDTNYSDDSTTGGSTDSKVTADLKSPGDSSTLN